MDKNKYRRPLPCVQNAWLINISDAISSFTKEKFYTQWQWNNILPFRRPPNVQPIRLLKNLNTVESHSFITLSFTLIYLTRWWIWSQYKNSLYFKLLWLNCSNHIIISQKWSHFFLCKETITNFLNWSIFCFLDLCKF